MDGRQALIFSRIRENQLDPAWTDFARQHDQQLVEQAALAKLASPSQFFSLPFSGSSLLAPISTDLSTWQLMQLAWVKFRSSTGADLHCRLGGRRRSLDGQDVIVGETYAEQQVLAAVLGSPRRRRAEERPLRAGLHRRLVAARSSSGDPPASLAVLEGEPDAEAEHHRTGDSVERSADA